MIELIGITHKELEAKYGEPEKRVIMHDPGFRLSFQVSSYIRIQSKHYFYKKKKLRNIPGSAIRPLAMEEERHWLIIPRSRSKKLEKDAQKLKDNLFKEKTASELVEIAKFIQQGYTA